MGADPVAIDDSTVCRWLSWNFARELDDDILRVYASDGAAPIFRYLACHAPLNEPLERLQRAIADWTTLSDHKLELAADYAALFLGPGEAGAPLYASCYTPPGHLFGAAHERMLKRLQASDLAISTLSGEPADHLALMLDYLAHRLADEDQPAATVTRFETAGEFMQNELLSWLPAFRQRAQQVEVVSDTHRALIALTLETLVVFCQARESDAGTRDH